MGLENESLIGIFTTDPHLTVRVWDGAMEQMTGIRAVHAIGKPLVEVIPGLASRSLLSRFERVLRAGTIEILAPAFHGYLIPCPPAFASKHFSEMRQQVNIAPLKEDEAIVGLIVTVEDVTARMEQEAHLAEQLKHPDENVRLEASRAISAGEGPLVSENAVPVIDALEDKSWRVRRNIVEGMRRRAAPDAIEALLRAMREKHFEFGTVNGALQILRANAVDTTATLVEFLTSGEPDLRIHAALALGEQNDTSAVESLIAALEDDDANVRYHAIEALGKLGAREATEPLLQIAESRDFFLSFAALDALTLIADPSVAGRVTVLLDDERLREPAIRLLGRIGSSDNVPRICELMNADRSLVPVVAAAIVDLYESADQADVKSQIIAAARQAVSGSGQERIAQALETAAPSELPKLITFAGWFYNERSIPTFVEFLYDHDLRERAAEALALQGEASVEALSSELDSEDEEVRRAAANALARAGGAEAVKFLGEMLNSGVKGDITIAAEALAANGTAEAIRVLQGSLTDTDPAVRAAAVRGLGRLGDKEAILKGSEDDDEGVRRAAIELLPDLQGDFVVPTLIAALETETPRGRAVAAQSLARVDHPDSVAALRKALNDTDAWTRYFVVRGIGRLRDVSSVKALVSIAETDPAEHVRVAAREVVIELGL